MSSMMYTRRLVPTSLLSSQLPRSRTAATSSRFLHNRPFWGFHDEDHGWPSSSLLSSKNHWEDPWPWGRMDSMFMMLPMHPLAKPARLIPHLHRDHKEDGDDTARDAGIQWFSPGYEIKQPNSTSSSSDGKYVIRVNVPGIQASDLKVQVLDDGRTLHISGETQRHTALPSDGPDSEPHATTTSSSMSFQFTKYFTIGKNMDLDKMTAHLDKGVLTISAPVREAVSSHGHTIAITEGDLEQKEEQSSAIADGK